MFTKHFFFSFSATTFTLCISVSFFFFNTKKTHLSVLGEESLEVLLNLSRTRYTVEGRRNGGHGYRTMCRYVTGSARTQPTAAAARATWHVRSCKARVTWDAGRKHLHSSNSFFFLFLPLIFVRVSIMLHTRREGRRTRRLTHSCFFRDWCSLIATIEFRCLSTRRVIAGPFSGSEVNRITKKRKRGGGVVKKGVSDVGLSQ